MMTCKQLVDVASWSLCLGILAVAIGGCGAGLSSPQAVFDIHVTIGQKPVENLRIGLSVKGSADDRIVLEGITDHMGTAAMLLKEGVALAKTPTEYAVVCESLGDWYVAKPWSENAKTPLSVTWPSNTPLSIELPAKAARPL